MLLVPPEEVAMTNVCVSPENWGIRPTLFTVGGFGVPSYSVFMLLALLTGILVYILDARRRNTLSDNSFYILISAVTGGAIGSKVPMIVLYGREIAAHWPDLGILLSGRSIVGALVGGSIGVYLVKRFLKLQGRRGDPFAPAMAAGIAVGRLGCFLRGCCYGTPTALPWGFDFGDGIARHPTQLYESLFALGLFAALVALRDRVRTPGMLFRIMMVSYFAFRFAAEFVRVEPPGPLGLSVFQWVSLVIVAWYGKDIVRWAARGWS